MWNLLAQVNGMIPTDPVKYRKYSSSTLNGFGIEQQSYGAEVSVPGAYVQPVRSAMYAQLGLQVGKNVRQVFIPANVQGMENMSDGGDVLIFEGKTWKIKAVEDWYAHDGWKVAIVIEDKVYSAL